MSTTTNGHRPNALFAIVAGGLIAGSLDLTSAFITYGWGVPRGIAAGLLGRQALQGGAGIWVLGLFLHYFIAFAAATVYCVSSRKLDFLKSHFLVCGMFFGIALYLVMKLIVLPLSGLHSVGPFGLRDLIQGIVVHMILIGVPISYCARRFAC